MHPIPPDAIMRHTAVTANSHSSSSTTLPEYQQDAQPDVRLSESYSHDGATRKAHDSEYFDNETSSDNRVGYHVIGNASGAGDNSLLGDELMRSEVISPTMMVEVEAGEGVASTVVDNGVSVSSVRTLFMEEAMDVVEGSDPTPMHSQVSLDHKNDTSASHDGI